MSDLAHPIVMLATMGGVYLVAVASPGPNFFVASQLALSGERRLGVLAGAGIACGSMIWSSLTMVGVATIMAHAAWLQLGIRIFASLYLAWFGIKLVRSALTRGPSSGMAVRLPQTGGQAFRAGFITNMTNPKAAAFWTSIFGAMFPVDAPVWMYPVTSLFLASLCFGWYLSVAFLLSTERVQRGYDRVRRPIDAILGTALVGLGAHLALSR